MIYNDDSQMLNVKKFEHLGKRKSGDKYLIYNDDSQMLTPGFPESHLGVQMLIDAHHEHLGISEENQ